MLTVTYGPPRSGKTYRLVDKISTEFKKYKDGTSKYKHIYTNINGLKFDKFEGFVVRYNKQDLEKAMNDEYLNMGLNENRQIAHDGDYDKWVIENKIISPFNNCLIIIDEAYNTFTKVFEDPKGRFLSYHGHFNIDIDLILQSKRQVNREYLVHVEITYVAVPSGKRISSKIFKYKNYSTCDILRANYIETTSLRFRKEIYELYSSGGNEIYKSFIGKKLFPLFVLIIVVYVYFNFFSSPSLSQEPKKEILKTEVALDINQTKKTLPVRDTHVDSLQGFSYDENSVFIRAVCYPDSCRIDNHRITLSERNILNLLNKFDCKVLFYESFSTNYSHYYLSCSPQISNFLKEFREEKNYEKNRNFDSDNL